MVRTQFEGYVRSRASVNPDNCRSLPELFEQIVELYGSRTALGTGSWQPTYGELDERANSIANAIISRGCIQGDRVALLMRHDSPLIAGMLGILKAGSVVVALNAKEPQAQLQTLQRHADVRLILTDADNSGLAAKLATDFCDWLSIDDLPAVGSSGDHSRALSPNDVAFLIYTSGTTGRPKAVMETHEYVLNNAVRHGRVMEFVPEDRLTFFASLSGAQGVSTAWSALAHGAALCPFPVIEKGVTGLADWINDNGITVYRSSASLFRHFMSSLDDDVRFPRMRVVRVASELATSEDFRYFQKHFTDDCSFVHCLSTSETGNIAQLRLSRRDTVAEGPLPTGVISEGVKIVLRDDDGQEVPRGQQGEIFVVSRVLAAGYWRDDALTKQKFSEGPEGSGLRIFRTGDIGRVDADGMLEHLGRKDARVKIRGFQVEPSAVEASLRHLPGVAQAVVVTVEKPQKGTQLVAFVVFHTGQELPRGELRRRLRFVLPDHMIPSGFEVLDRFPLTPHSKIDRKTLLQIHAVRHRSQSSEQPGTDTEKLVAEIWAEVFELAEVGRNDDFFDLGGDSLSGAVIAAQIHAALGVEFNLEMFARHPTLKALAGAVDELQNRANQSGNSATVSSVLRDKPLPLSLIQERIWNFCKSPDANANYTMTRCHRIHGPLDATVLQRCMDYLARRHEILRTEFHVVDGQPVQIVTPPAPVQLSIVDVSGHDDADERAARIVEREAGIAIDLAKAPLVRFTLVRIRPNEHLMARANHHLIGDGPSWTRYNKELALLYEAEVSGRDAPFPDSMPLQYADYAAWQRSMLRSDGPRYREIMQWWQQRMALVPPSAELPFKRSEPQAGVDPSEGYFRWSLDAQTNNRLSRFARETGATFFQTRLAAYVALLSSYMGTSGLVVGTYFGTQVIRAGLSMLGDFATMTPLVLTCSRLMTFRELVRAVTRDMSEAEAHSEIPYEEVCRHLVSQNMTPPEVQTIVSKGADHSDERFANLRLVWEPPKTQRMSWGLTIGLDEVVEDNCVAAFDAGIYDPIRVRSFVDHYRRLLDAASRHPDQSIESLIAMSA